MHYKKIPTLSLVIAEKMAFAISLLPFQGSGGQPSFLINCPTSAYVQGLMSPFNREHS